MLIGVNKKCQQCSKSCKQWEQVKVIICPFFASRQQGVVQKEEDRLKDG